MSGPLPGEGAPPPADGPGSAGLPGPSAPAAVAELTDGEWHRLHPATPLLKGGIALIVVLGIIVNNAREWVVGFFVPGGRRPDGDGEGDPFGYVVEHGFLGFVLLGVLVVIAVLVLVFWLSWRMNTFRVTEEIVEVRSGVVFRTNRRARLDRVQGINIQRPVLARVFGAAKLEVSQAGDDANVSLAYLRSAAADDLRREILRRASGVQRSAVDGVRAVPSQAAPAQAASEQAAPAQRFVGLVEQRAQDFLSDGLDPQEAPPESVVKVDAGRLIGSVLLSGYTLFLVAAAIAVVVSVRVTGEFFLLFALLPAVLGSSGYYVNRVTKSLRYSISSSRDGIRIGYGLFSTTNETLPPGRIHSVKVSQPLLWRPFGWWQISINRASRSSTDGSGHQGNSTLLPVGDEADVRRVLELVLPELVGVAAAEVQAEERAEERAEEASVPSSSQATFAEAAEAAESAEPAGPGSPAEPARAVVDEHASHTLSLVEDGLTSRGSEGGFTTSPRRAAVLRWFSWRRNGFRTAPGALLLRKGAIWRELVVVPLPRMQSVGLSQGPLLRRLRLAAVHLHTVQGPIIATIGALDQDDAMAFFEGAARDAVTSARADRTHRWAASSTPAPAPAPAVDPADPAPASSAPVAPVLKFESDPSSGSAATPPPNAGEQDLSRIADAPRDEPRP
ncbi:PH domain-containing protein [Frigoribacterium sp. PvP032]|uniref:PH domain-containing protein n=1 Tax=Frigoribacterium sp. PvP032 TaxID=2806589 RepID=UPI001AE490F5|nr:PH domain-containing protein [Frigoribacterium sp. PvP032]MBP1189092.1 putative membrane protein [Frigoribacterium sp. PvP032]